MTKILSERPLNESDKDRLSDLPDHVLLYILSFLNNPKHVIQTCILSTRWKHLWKHGFPALTLHYQNTNFSSHKTFDRFVSRILQFRDNSTLLHTFQLERRVSTSPRSEWEYSRSIHPRILGRIASSILSHTNHLRQLAISLKGDISLVLPCVSACQTLTSLKLSLYPKGRNNFEKILFPKSLNLPALTSLDLTNFAFCANENNNVEPFSVFKQLNSLTISKCAAMDKTKIMRISSETLVTLSLVKNCYGFTKIDLLTPSLCNITFIGENEKLCGSNLSSVKQVYINLGKYLPSQNALINWFLNLPNITSLTLTPEIVVMISLSVVKDKFSSLCHLKSLKLKTWIRYSESSEKRLLEAIKSWKEEFEDRIERDYMIEIGSTIGFLCQNSPSAKFDLEYDVDSYFIYVSK